MHIAFITNNYPAPSRPECGTFVQQFVWALARRGSKCTVIKPTSVFERRYGPYPPLVATEDAGGGSSVQVHRPRYLSFSCRDLGWTHTGRWTYQTFNAAAVSSLKSLYQKPDLIYGHFLYNAGRTAVAAGERLSVPSIVAVGEGTFWTVDPFGFDRAKKDFESAAGFIAVASHIRDGLVEQIGIPSGKITVEPNGVDRSRFRPIDRQHARERLGLDASRFLVAFVGAFDNLKGGSELVQATKGIDGVGLLLLGNGDVDLSSDRVVFNGSVKHDQVHIWLNAADVFVLPTKEEGSCNAVIEAMACGLPIITSNGRYMDDIVDDEVAIRVDPTNVAQIRDAIMALKNDPERRKQMTEACLQKAKRLDINERARRVTEWMGKLINDRGAERAN